VARFLVELAGHSAVPDRTTLLDYLYFWVPGADCGPLNEKKLDEFSWEVVNAIRAGLPLYIGLLHDDDPAVRSRAGWLITHCAPLEIDRAANVICEQVEHEQDASVLAELALALGTFRRTADVGLLRDLVVNVQPTVRAAAAIAWIQIAAEVPTAAAAVLVDASSPPGNQEPGRSRSNRLARGDSVRDEKGHGSPGAARWLGGCDITRQAGWKGRIPRNAGSQR
jgi:hypothetical protein